MFNYPIGSGNAPAKKKPMAAKPAMEPEQEMGEEDGSAVAQEHGPAHEVHVTHDHAAGVHHVHSVHPDGHEHHSEHGSVEEAHEHGKQLASGEEQDDDWGDEAS